jgi:hypothetical protein
MMLSPCGLDSSPSTDLAAASQEKPQVVNGYMIPAENSTNSEELSLDAGIVNIQY